MSESDNVQLVKDAYAAFLRGDIPSVLAKLDASIDWHGVIGTEGVLPQSGRRHGLAEVEQFFHQVAASTDFATFETTEYVAQGDQVVALGRYTGHLKPNGHPFASEWVMIFDFREGRVTRFREFLDSAQIVKAYTAPATASV